MYQPSDPQLPLFDASAVTLPPEKRERCEKSWAGPFRDQALPLLKGIEGEFAGLYHPELGRPNRPVALLLGTLVLEEMFDLTDEEALSALEFDARWWWAFQLPSEELHLAQKTLHNFRVALMKNDLSKVAFRRVTDQLVRILAVGVTQQRIDSTHVLSNIAERTRLGLFCETIRVALAELKRYDVKRYDALPAGILKRHGERSKYFDAKPAEGRRRLSVVARDMWRLLERFKDDAELKRTEGWKLLDRLFQEQCRVLSETKAPAPEDDDQGEGGAPVELKPGKEIPPNSLQSPHDSDATYSGHKGTGYEVQVAETCTNDNPVQLITETEVTPSCGSDSTQTVPIVDALTKAGHKPEEVVADTAYGGAPNAVALAEREVGLLSPVPGPTQSKLPRLPENQAPQTPCPKNEEQALTWLREQEAAADFHRRYKVRAGIEGTNCELKHGHGADHLRVRGLKRLKLVMYFKVLACNIKRALRYWLRSLKPEAPVVLPE